jgi:hypothetical protein
MDRRIHAYMCMYPVAVLPSLTLTCPPQSAASLRVYLFMAKEVKYADAGLQWLVRTVVKIDKRGPRPLVLSVGTK